MSIHNINRRLDHLEHFGAGPGLRSEPAHFRRMMRPSIVR